VTTPVPLKDEVTDASRRSRYESAGWWDSSTLAGRVVTHGADKPMSTAVVAQGRRRTYRDLATDAAALAVALEGRGVTAGAVVSVQLPNWYEFVVVATAVQSLRAVINPILPNYRLHELGDIFAVARPVMIVTPAEYRGFDYRRLVADVVGDGGPSVRHVVVGGDAGPQAESFASLLEEAAPSDLRPGEADVVSELIFTSGTEARPKAIMHTEQTTNFSVRVAYEDLGLTDDDVVWMPSPLGHSTGFNYGLRFALYHGLPLVLQDRWDAEDAARLIEEERCSYTLAATTFLQDLTEAAGRNQVRLDSMTYFGCGGAPVPPSLVDQAEAVGIGVLRLYGSTEVLVGSWNRPTSSATQKRTTDGLPLDHLEMEVRDDGGAAVARGQAGELFVRGPNTCVGFFGDRERTAATFSDDGWVRTGDEVIMTDDGYVTVVGRKKEIIIRGGLNIAPREIEEMLVAFPEIERAAVIGLPDVRLGERMCACVVLRPGRALDLETVVERLTGAGLATYKLPERLEIVDALPATASGKIQKHELVRIFGPGGSDAHEKEVR
jgi:non-ribosomal peptide synthetase component E (peptide arylation enzyme)